jgi:hypothetical protein
MDVHLRSAFHPLLGRVRIGASRVRPLSPKLHTSDYSFACPGSSTWVDKVPSRDTPTLNLAGHRDDVALDAPQVARRVAGLRCRNPAPSEPDGTIARHPAQASAASCAARKIRLRLRHAFPFVVTPVGPFDAKHRLTSPTAVVAPSLRFRRDPSEVCTLSGWVCPALAGPICPVTE